ncbi:hypothetical protein F5B22DRAFT_640859 [Xylaria bambusicola]|uniref:uncharacterized protein n=1 Tax=Xylaria bambusicola TaxID=326684 RepID=UPI00200762B0|nr:uncharacterized protein F5B22DRAFT_640859 [Xylaria bambusicola]KAI0527883.1 hypothetical protein F5B22DRAFT_640859 [Xylaria bambusicola]
MAANIQQIGANAGLRRPHQAQLSQLLYAQLMTQNVPTTGWHTSVTPQTRVGHAMNIITNSFLAMPQADSSQVISVGITYERDAFTTSPDKATYEARLMTRVNELFRKRQANEQNIHHNLTAQAAQNQLMMNQNMQMRGMNQPLQQGFQGLQQMQQSPTNQQGQPNMGVNNNPNGLGTNSNQQMLQAGGQMRPQMAMQAMQARMAANLTPQEQAKIHQLAVTKLHQMPEANRTQYRIMVQAKLGPQLLAQLQQENVDPLMYFFQNQFTNGYLQTKGQTGVNQMGMTMQVPQQRSMNQPVQQLPNGQTGDFSPFSNVDIMNQQKAGLMAQEAGQMVVPASGGAGRNATPQPMGSLPGPNQGTGQPIPHQMQPPFGAHQPSQQLKMDQRAAQSQAQIRAQAHAKQMQGQPGGLNGLGGTSQSPAMNTLNAPVRRTPIAIGQTEGQPQIGQGNVAFGQHMMDPRFNQTGQRTPIGPNGNMNNRNQMIHNALAQMPAEIRQQIMSLPQDKIPEMIMRWNANRTAGTMSGRPQPQGGQLGPGNPMAQSMAQFAPGTNIPGQHPNLGTPMNQQSQLMLQQMNQLRNPNGPQGTMDRNALMDNMPVPKEILDQVRITSAQGGAIPLENKKWGWFKQFLIQKNVSQQQMNHVLQMQARQFAEAMAQNANKAANANPAVTSSQVAQPNIPQQGAQPNGQLTHQSAQPLPNPPPNPAGGNLSIVISPQEIQNAKKHEKFKGWTDEKVRAMLMQMKTQAFKNRAAAQMSGTPAQPPSAPQVSQPTPAATAPALQSQSANGAAVPPKQQNGGPETSTTSPVSQGRNIKQPQNNNTPSVTVPPTVKTGTKRPMPDDGTEVPNPSRTPVQRSQQIPPQMPHFTAEQLATLTPEQRQKYEAMVRSRQSAPTAQMSEDMLRLKAIGQEQHQAGVKEQLPDIPMTPEQYQDTAQKVQNMCIEMNKVSKVLGRWYSATHDDARARLFFKLRMRLVKQYADGEKMSVLRDKFSITPADMEQIRGMFESVAKDLSTHFPNMMKKNPSQQNSSEPAPTQGGSTRPGAPTAQPAPLNAANLEKQTQAYIKMHQRSSSKAGQPPAAPTTAQPPFPFGAQSPDGQPTYAGKPSVTQDSLQLPARKRPKTEAKAGTGTGQNGSSANASPQVPKLSSPDMSKRQAPTEVRQALPKFTCPEQHCEFRLIGFPTEDALRKHRDEEHIKPAEDPFKFATESLAEVLGLDANGKLKKAPTTVANNQSPADASKHGPTPVVKADAPMKRQGSTTGSKPSELIKTIAGKTSTPKPEAVVKSEGATPIALPNGGAIPQFQSSELLGTTIDPQELLSGVTGLEFGGDGAISDMNVYRSITPNDTPESFKDSASSEPNSDLSEGVALNVTLDMGFGTWDPFALGHDATSMDMGGMDLSGLPYPGFTWDEVNPEFDKPFSIDTSFFQLDAS